MKIPKTLKIGGHIYNVKVVKQDLGGGKYGSVSFDSNEILLRGNISSSSLGVNLLHEIIHTCDHHSRLAERDIEDLAESLYQVLKDNDLSFS